MKKKRITNIVIMVLIVVLIIFSRKLFYSERTFYDLSKYPIEEFELRQGLKSGATNERFVFNDETMKEFANLMKNTKITGIPSSDFDVDDTKLVYMANINDKDFVFDSFDFNIYKSESKEIYILYVIDGKKAYTPKYFYIENNEFISKFDELIEKHLTN